MTRLVEHKELYTFLRYNELKISMHYNCAYLTLCELSHKLIKINEECLHKRLNMSALLEKLLLKQEYMFPATILTVVEKYSL